MSKDLKFKQYLCTLCKEIFSNVENAYNHEEMHHKVIQNEYPDYVFEPLIVHVQSQQFLR